VFENTGSARQEYAQRQRAIAPGCEENNVIDSDLGLLYAARELRSFTSATH
jgi:hypothetical protein